MKSFFGKNQTMKMRKVPENTKQYELKKYAEATLGSGNLKLAVALPEGEDLNEWLAVHVVDFFNQVTMLYGSISEYCTEETCKVMSAGPQYEYYWADGVTVKKPIQVSAPEYVNRLMTWIQSQLDNEEIFPSRMGYSFPKNFMSIVKTIFKRLFRVYGHIYHHHFKEISSLGEEAHLNTSFKHFIFFMNEFRILDKKEKAPLRELIQHFIDKDKKREKEK
eukprot:Anaeramoba_ignava/a106041_81.p1 GENE.a106041_81~~a106041_81.p1  ORF type:complete len:220 (-),score=53.89 a106041_81:391-1050(-)